MEKEIESFQDLSSNRRKSKENSTLAFKV